MKNEKLEEMILINLDGNNITFRLTKSMKKELKKHADKNFRPLTSEVICILNQKLPGNGELHKRLMKISEKSNNISDAIRKILVDSL